AEAQRGAVAALEGGRLPGRRLGRRRRGLEMRQQRAAQLGQLGEVPLAVEQGAADLLLQALDGAGQRRLRDVAGFGRAGGGEGLGQAQEVADLKELHLGARPPCASPGSRVGPYGARPTPRSATDSPKPGPAEAIGLAITAARVQLMAAKTLQKR